VGTFFSGIWETIKTTFANIGSTVGTALSSGIKTAINWILEKAVGLINGFIDGINWCIDIINAIPGISITKITRLEVPKLAKGGITTGSTIANIGEGGFREAVLPLERNTEWMDILADRIAERNGAPSKIVLTLDGNELGWASIHSINSITQQTGVLQLKV
jgi:phage-related protein